MDGIRHGCIQEKIAALVAPSPAFLIHLAADDEHVQQRVGSRGALGDLNRAEVHAVEAELRSSLPHIADRVINANAPLPVVLNQCLTAIEQFGAPALKVARARAALSTMKI